MQIVRKSQVIEILEQLLGGKITRCAASNWAEDLVCRDIGDVSYEDDATWQAVSSLWAADLITTDRPYLYDEVDFLNWLDELRRSSNTVESGKKREMHS